jgi:type VI secretion system protein ImpE
MSAEQLLKDGDLPGCMKVLQDQIRNDPSNLPYRVFLFQMLSVLGDWKRALTQLDVIKEMDTATWPMVQTYREAVQCEALREGIFSGERSPLVFGDPEQWVALVVEALRLSAGGVSSHSQELREQAFEQAPTTSGKIDDNDFVWLADADARLGPILEVIVNGNYYWIPLHQIREIRIEEPEDLRDFVWTVAQFRWSNGGEAVGLIPTRYPGSDRTEDSLIQLARKTQWTERQPGVYEGLGQRLLATNADDYSLLDIRSILLDTETEASE